MSLTPRIKISGEAAGYHVTMRTNGREYRLDDDMKKFFIKTLKRLKTLYYVHYYGFAVLDNHYHLLLRLDDYEDIDPKEALERWNAYHEEQYQKSPLSDKHRDYVARQLTDISSFMKRLNVLLTRQYNRATGSTGTLWESRFRSSVVERGPAMAMCGAYIELNGFRASKVKKPEDYVYSSIHMLTEGDPDKLMDIDLIAESFDQEDLWEEGKEPEEREDKVEAVTQAYLRVIYESGTTPHRDEHGIPEEGGRVITEKMLEHLKRHTMRCDRGAFADRCIDYVRSKFLGSERFAEAMFERYVRAKVSTQDTESWLHATAHGLWSVRWKGGLEHAPPGDESG